MLLDSMIFGYLERVSRCSRQGEVAEALGREAARMDLSAVACWMLTGPKAASRDPFYANNWPQPWLDLYERHGFFEKDPFARWAISSGAPVSWGTLLRRLPSNDPAHEIGLAARNFGFREGFGTPVRSSTGHLGLFTFFGDRRPLNRGEEIFLQAICPGTLHRMEALAPAAEPTRPAGLLSARERECAFLLCEGLSNPAIADRLGIAVATVKFHLANACTKLGARSRAQLAALLPSTAKGIGERGGSNGSSRHDGAATLGPAGGDRIASVKAGDAMLLRSDDGRYFRISPQDALPFEVRRIPADSPSGRPPAPLPVPVASARDLADAEEDDAVQGVDPYWDWRNARAVGESWSNRWANC